MTEEKQQKQDGAGTFFPAKFVLPLIVLHLLVALPLSFVLNVWVDEASTLYTTGNGFFHAFGNALADEIQAPLYFWLLSIWRQIDGSIFFARLFSILCGVLAIKAAFDVARRFLPEYARKFAVAIFALHPFLFWASTEARGYSLAILLSALLLRFFYDAYLTEEPALKAKICYIAVSIVALYTNYFLGFFLVGNFCALLALRKNKQAAYYLGHMVIVGAGFLPLLYALSQQLEARAVVGDKSFLAGARNAWQHIQTFILPVNVFSDEKNLASLVRLWIFRAGAAGIFIYLVIKKFKGISSNTLALGVINLVLALFLLAVVAMMGAGYANIRHAAIMLLPLVMFFSALLYEMFAKKGLIVWAALLVFFIPFSLFQQFSLPVKRGDWEKAAAYVEAHESPGQVVLLFEPYDSLAFKVYYKGQSAVLPQEGFFPWVRKNRFTSAETLPQQTQSLISQIPPGAKEVWLLTGEICDDPKTLAACEPLEDFMDSNYTMIDSQNFYLEKARLYRKK
jgi:hypothetical protein